MPAIFHLKITKTRKHMDDDKIGKSNGITKSSKKITSSLNPVPACSSGIGLPYAPEDWPNPGDNWKWRVGNRIAAGGYWVDKVISPPKYFPKNSGCKARFLSRLSLANYIRKEFPAADFDAFFGSFSWKIPADRTRRADMKMHNILKNNERSEVNKRSNSKSSISSGGCKAGNKMCTLVKLGDFKLKFKTCDICCNEAGFCRDCSCILCCRSVDSAHGGFSFIRCLALVEKDLSCGHAAHINCALRAYMAGTVGGSIGLDAEYYCRRCDNKTNLIQHVLKAIETCQSLDSRDDIEKVLNLGSCILSGSETVRAKNLCNLIRNILSKLNNGVSLTEIWIAKNDISTISTVDAESSIYSNHIKSLFDVRPSLCIISDHTNISAKLEDEISHSLQNLKNLQESEYKIAEVKLHAQKGYLLGLYQKLEVERSDLARQTPLANGRDGDVLLTSVLTRVDQIKCEETKLKQMMRVSEGFMRTPAVVLRKYFGIFVDQ